MTLLEDMVNRGVHGSAQALTEGRVKINGAVCLDPGRQLAHGDDVVVRGNVGIDTWRVSLDGTKDIRCEP